MKNIFRALVILSICFASATLQAAPTKLDCKNSSTNVDMKLTIAGVITTVEHGTTETNISISSSVTSLQVRPSSLIGVPITIQKSDLNIASDGKYDMEIKTSLNGLFLTVTVYSVGEKIGQGRFTIGA